MHITKLQWARLQMTIEIWWYPAQKNIVDCNEKAKKWVKITVEVTAPGAG